jgi:methylglutaconyl-CoA hydratase
MELPKPMGSLTTINNTIATVQFSHPASNSFKEIVRLLSEELNQLSSNADVSVVLRRRDRCFLCWFEGRGFGFAI